jgi:TolA-binding protein
VSREPDGPTSDPLDPRVAELLKLAGETLGEMTPGQAARGKQELRAHLRGAERRRRQTRWLAATAVGAAAAAVLLVPRVLHRAPLAPLAYELKDGSFGEGGVIRAGADDSPALRFIDGTRIELAPGTSGRLAEVDDRGAHVAIARGSALVNVVPKPRARWVIDAGPFRIAVHGTVFTAAWDDVQGRLDVRLERGLVSVTGPVADGPIPVRSGQHLTVTLGQKRVLLRNMNELDDREDRDLTPPAPAAAPLAVAPATAPAQPTVTARPSHVRVAVAKSWAAELAAGDFDAILEDAARDLTRALASRGTDELAALADAARYRRRDDVARRALQAQRRRFPGSARAADAAFFLGRLSESGGGAAGALDWYDRYLAEAPEGPYAGDALGRKMVAVRDLRGEAAARAVADEYLRRFPHGSYAGAANALRGGR